MPEYSETGLTNFAGGLITEAGKLNSPENASVDEINCDLLRDGSRRRRLGLEFEDGVLQSTETVDEDTVFSSHVWSNVAEQPGVEFVVVQFGAKITFYQTSDTNALSRSRVPTSNSNSDNYVLNLSQFETTTGKGASSSPIQVASIKGALVIVSPDINGIILTRDKDTGAFSASTIDYKVRDFEYLGDVANYTEEGAGGFTFPDFESDEVKRYYDTLNTGWVPTPKTNPLAVYRAASGDLFPPLTHPWYSGKDSDGVFDKDEWEEIYSGNTIIVNGHFILDLHDQDRLSKLSTNSLVSNVLGALPFVKSVEESRFSTVANFAGRIFFSGFSNSTNDNGTKVYFSPLLEKGFNNVGHFYQVNDPTSEELNSLLDTDGGYFSIPEAHEIKKMHVFGSALYVFASNGVWRVSGVDDVFRATEYSVSKISEEGIYTAESFVSALGRPYWWAPSGIYTFVTNDVGDIRPQNISLAKIDTFWKAINPSARAKVKGAYDIVRNRVMWLYQNNNEEVENKLNKVLIFDESLQAFIPWKFEDQETDTSYLVSLVFDRGVASDSRDLKVIDSDGNKVVDSNGDFVVVTRSDPSLTEGSIKFVAVRGDTDEFSFAETRLVSFLDWDETDYDSFLKTAYNVNDSLEVRHSQPYLTVYAGVTETGWEADGNGYSPVREGSLRVTSFWDFRSGQSSPFQQGYRLKKPPVVNTGDLTSFGYESDHIITRIRLRGRGRVVNFKFGSETGKDFHLIGYGVIKNSSGRF